MSALVNYHQRQRQLKKLDFMQRVPWPDHLSTTERSNKSPQMLLEASQWASRSLVYLYYLYNWLKNLYKVLRKPIFWQFFGNGNLSKFARSQNLWQNPPLYTWLILFLNSCDMQDSGRLNALNMRWCRNLIQNFFHKKCGQSCGKKTKNRLKTECNEGSIFHRLGSNRMPYMGS